MHMKDEGVRKHVIYKTLQILIVKPRTKTYFIPSTLYEHLNTQKQWRALYEERVIKLYSVVGGREDT